MKKQHESMSRLVSARYDLLMGKVVRSASYLETRHLKWRKMLI